MKNNTIDLTKLPHEAQVELKDFYEFLMKKYTSKDTISSPDVSSLFPRTVDVFIPIAREDLYAR